MPTGNGTSRAHAWRFASLTLCACLSLFSLDFSWLVGRLPACADMPGCLACCLPGWQAGWLTCCFDCRLCCMISLCTYSWSLCLCLGQLVAKCDPNFKFSAFSTSLKIRRDTSQSSRSLHLAAPPHAVKHANVWLWADFLKCSLSIFFSDFFFSSLCVELHTSKFRLS